MHALIAGGAGFIGQNLSRVLLAHGWNVDIIDLREPGPLASTATDSPRAFVGDVLTWDTPRHYDAIINLASPASVDVTVGRPIDTMRINALGCDRLARIASKTGARFIEASSSEIYGRPEVHPQHEGYFGNVDPTGPRGAYNEAKRYCEALTAAYVRQEGLSAGIVRFFNGYGPGLDDGRVVPSFIRAVLDGKPIPINGDGTQTRSFCYVDDLCEGVRLLLEDTRLGPFNLGNPSEITMLGLARVVFEVVGRDTGIEYMPLPPEDPARRCPDITKAEDELGYSPTVDLSEGVERTLRWLMAERTVPVAPD